MAPYFPFGERVGFGTGETMNIKVRCFRLRVAARGSDVWALQSREAMQTLNLAYCELVSLLVSRASPTDQASRRRAKKGRKGAGGEVGGSQVREVAAYIVRCLRGEVRSVCYPEILYIYAQALLWVHLVVDWLDSWLDLRIIFDILCCASTHALGSSRRAGCNVYCVTTCDFRFGRRKQSRETSGY